MITKREGLSGIPFPLNKEKRKTHFDLEKKTLKEAKVPPFIGFGI